MWLQAILTLDDLTKLVNQLTPLKIRLGDGKKSDHYLYLGTPSEIELVPDKGLRVRCPAKVRVALPFVRLPVALPALQIVLCPSVRSTKKGDVLAFTFIIEEADLKHMPPTLDRRIVRAVNRSLIANQVELAWNFSETLRGSFELPKLMEPTDHIRLKVQWGEVKVTDEALVMAVSFGASITRKRSVTKA